MFEMMLTLYRWSGDLYDLDGRSGGLELLSKAHGEHVQCCFGGGIVGEK